MIYALTRVCRFEIISFGYGLTGSDPWFGLPISKRAAHEVQKPSSVQRYTSTERSHFETECEAKTGGMGK